MTNTNLLYRKSFRALSAYQATSSWAVLLEFTAVMVSRLAPSSRLPAKGRGSPQNKAQHDLSSGLPSCSKLSFIVQVGACCFWLLLLLPGFAMDAAALKNGRVLIAKWPLKAVKVMNVQYMCTWI
jgi:hypothetical protein